MTHNEKLERLLDTPPPRRVPHAIAQRVVSGGADYPIVSGSLLILAGAAAAIALRFPALALVSGIGLLLFIVSGLKRRRETHLLAVGLRCPGRITGVEATSVRIGRQRQYAFSFTHEGDGQAVEGLFHAYGFDADRARELYERGETVPFLYDPGRPERALPVRHFERDD